MYIHCTCILIYSRKADDYILYGATMVALENTLILSGGYSPRNGAQNLVFEYHPLYGFRVLSLRLQEPR